MRGWRILTPSHPLEGAEDAELQNLQPLVSALPQEG